MKVRKKSKYLVLGAIILVVSLKWVQVREQQGLRSMFAKANANAEANARAIEDQLPRVESAVGTGGKDREHARHLPSASKASRSQAQESKAMTTTAYKKATDELVKNQFHIQGLEVNRRRIAELASDDEVVALSARILENNTWTRAEYGANQAASRVLAIKILSERARQGDLRPLTDVTVKLGSSIQELDGGQRADFRDLVTELILVVGANRFFEDPSVIMQQFSNPSEVRKTVIAASVAHLGEKINDPEFMHRMRRWR